MQTTWGRATQFLLRVVAGLLFMLHGGQKLFGWFGGLGPGVAFDPTSMIGIAGILEFFGGALIVLGLFTRPVAFLLSGEMAIAYFTRHFPSAFWPIQNHGEPAALYAFIFLFFATNGAGMMSLDSLRTRERPATRAGEATRASSVDTAA